MKKTLFPIISLLIILTFSVTLWPKESHSEIDLPYTYNEDESDCQVAVKNGIYTLSMAWENNLNNLSDQPVPASEMVDDAFEGFRTYQCWMKYMCQSVKYSGGGNFANTINGGIYSDWISATPGCQDIEDVHLPIEWETYLLFIEEYWKSNYPKMTTDYHLDNLGARDRFHYIPQCSVGSGSISDITKTIQNYNMCLEFVSHEFRCTSEDVELGNIQNCASESIAFQKLKAAMYDAYSRQKMEALENKLAGILSKMLKMEMDVSYMKGMFYKLDALFPCWIKQCT